MTEYGRVKFCMSEEADLSPAIEAYCRYLPHDHASRSDMVEHMRVVTLKFGERITLVTDWETGTVVADRAADAAELCRMAGANTPAEVLTCLCANRAAADEEALVRFEPELYALEERFVTGRLRARDTGRELMRLRKRLLALHQRYAVLSVVLEEIADEAGRDALGSAIRRADRLRGSGESRRIFDASARCTSGVRVATAEQYHADIHRDRGDFYAAAVDYGVVRYEFDYARDACGVGVSDRVRRVRRACGRYVDLFSSQKMAVSRKRPVRENGALRYVKRIYFFASTRMASV